MEPIPAKSQADATRSQYLTARLTAVRLQAELAGKAAVAGELTAESTNEQQKAGLTACTPALKSGSTGADGLLVSAPPPPPPG